MDRREIVEFVAVQASLVAAGLHLVWGAPRSLVYLQVGRFSDPRPFLFVASAVGVVLAVTHLYYGDATGRAVRRVYGFLFAVLVLYFVGYAVWHVGGHPILSLHGAPTFQFHYHPTDPLSTLLDHLLHDAFALVNALVELVGIAGFGWLLLFDRAES